MNYFFITLFYSGLSPKAPGTVGTLVSLPLGMLILIYLDAQTLFLTTALISIIAIKEINKNQHIIFTTAHSESSYFMDAIDKDLLEEVMLSKVPAKVHGINKQAYELGYKYATESSN